MTDRKHAGPPHEPGKGSREPAERSHEPAEGSNEEREPPPFLGTWPRAYAVVLVWLAILIALFALFTRAFS